MRADQSIFTKAVRASGVVGLLFSCASFGQAYSYYSDKAILGYLMTSAVPTKPLARGAFDVKVSPGYSVYKDAADSTVPQDFKMSGYGVGASADYGLTNHWGVAAMFGYARMTGTDFLGLPATAQGSLASGNIIFDPFSGERFRLPIMFGVGYENNTQTGSSVASTPLGSSQVLFASKGLTTNLAVAPQWNTRYVGFGPFFYSMSLAGKSTSAPALVAREGNQSQNSGAVGAGFTVVYRPWDLSATYIPSFTNDVSHGETSSVYSMTLQHRFGG
jgi:hypothetical protein